MVSISRTKLEQIIMMLEHGFKDVDEGTCHERMEGRSEFAKGIAKLKRLK